MQDKYEKIFGSSDCVSEEVLLRYVNGSASGNENQLVEKHVMDCEICSDILDGLMMLQGEGKNIDKMVAKLSDHIENEVQQNSEKKQIKYILPLAACIALLVGVGLYWMANEKTNHLAHQLNEEKTVLDAPEQKEMVILEKNIDDASPATKREEETILISDYEEVELDKIKKDKSIDFDGSQVGEGKDRSDPNDVVPQETELKGIIRDDAKLVLKSKPDKEDLYFDPISQDEIYSNALSTEEEMYLDFYEDPEENALTFEKPEKDREKDTKALSGAGGNQYDMDDQAYEDRGKNTGMPEKQPNSASSGKKALKNKRSSQESVTAVPAQNQFINGNNTYANIADISYAKQFNINPDKIIGLSEDEIFSDTALINSLLMNQGIYMLENDMQNAIRYISSYKIEANQHCFYPYHAIVFYNSMDIPVNYGLISFMCNKLIMQQNMLVDDTTISSPMDSLKVLYRNKGFNVDDMPILDQK